ncbi:hypothetical protein CXB51_022470 [Gossypium anomalum]|uniref:SWIM-type domain-containing protein n=1 Tax=Gossypium anomalum TaxID=47600 RepID=A0A8J5YVT8_9ROSI|nr:hypothetical protein CXB51_022470 [Gossypium anomalum]
MEARHVFIKDVRDAMVANRRMARSINVEIYSRRLETFRVTETIGCRPSISPRSYGVDLRNRRCDCRRFQTLHYPCAHVVENEFPVLPDLSTWEVPLMTFKLVPDRGLRRNPRERKGEKAPFGYLRLESRLYAGNISGHDVRRLCARNISGLEVRRLCAGNISGLEVRRLRARMPKPVIGLGLGVLQGRPQSTRIRNEMDIREKSNSTHCGLCRLAGHKRSKCPQRNYHVGQSSRSGRN